MRIIDLHCYPNTKTWIDCQGPYVDALAKYWKRDWTWKEEDEVAAEFTENGIEACLVALDLSTTINTPPCSNDYVAPMRDRDRLGSDGCRAPAPSSHPPRTTWWSCASARSHRFDPRAVPPAGAAPPRVRRT